MLSLYEFSPMNERYLVPYQKSNLANYFYLFPVGACHHKTVFYWPALLTKQIQSTLCNHNFFFFLHLSL